MLPNIRRSRWVKNPPGLPGGKSVGISYSYHYNIDDFTTSVHASYSNTSKLIEMNLFEYETIIDEDIESEK